MQDYVSGLMEDVKAKNPAEPEFHQAVEEVAESRLPLPSRVSDPLLRVAEPFSFANDGVDATTNTASKTACKIPREATAGFLVRHNIIAILRSVQGKSLKREALPVIPL